MVDWYESWSARYAAIFGMSTADHIAMFAEWEKVFAIRQYTESELTAAMNAIASRPKVPAWRSEHLSALNEHIRQQRDRQARKEQDANADTEPSGKSLCELCSDTGQVIVPHPKFVKDGIWQHHGNHQPTCAVLCQCRRGERMHEAQLSKGLDKPQLLLATYEQRIPRPVWRGFYMEQAGERAQAATATNRTRDVDTRLGSLSAAIGTVPF